MSKGKKKAISGPPASASTGTPAGYLPPAIKWAFTPLLSGPSEKKKVSAVSPVQTKRGQQAKTMRKRVTKK